MMCVLVYAELSFVDVVSDMKVMLHVPQYHPVA